MTEWLQELRALEAQGESSVLLSVAGIRGSAPRETGAKMIVTATSTIGSIGGGQLEYQCIQQAAEYLRAGGTPQPAMTSRRFSLGANCGQCCGGVVEIVFEYLQGSGADWLTRLQRRHDDREPVVMLTSVDGAGGKFLVTPATADEGCPVDMAAVGRELLESGKPAGMFEGWLLEPVRLNEFHVAIFGAGHVGAATTDVLSRLACDIRWIDNRRNIFPATVPTNVAVVETAEPAREVAALPAGAYYLVMTHSHPMDLEICNQVLRRSDAAYCGLIGSRSKRRRFERLLGQQGLSRSSIDALVCPIGVAGLNGKRPVEIAIAVAAELLQKKEALAGRTAKTGLLAVTG
jgi:xanthine dehydrogenase accessory factor